MAFDPEKVTFFAKTDARGQNVPFGIKAKDRQRHVYVIGKTGMGKSTLLENMAVQDIQNGEGMAFIDPHGSAAEVLLNYIPEHRMNDVLYFAPFDMEYPVSFNIMEDVGPDKRHLVVSGLMSVFEKIWVDAWSARMAYILQNTLMALLEYPDSTLLGVNRMLSDKVYRNKVVENVKDPGVKSFWVDEFAKYNERYMQEAGDAIKNKIGQFTANPVIRNIIGQPKSSFDIRKMMDERKIIIMNLSKGLIGETNANLLGSMLTTRIYLAAMSRADLSPQQMKTMPNFYFYVDEFQSFANATFANILSEARKYHLNLTIAHQYIEQMEEDVRNAVFGNVGTIITFRVGPMDAEVLEKIFFPQFTAIDLVNLSFAQVYLTLMIDGIGSPPFSASTLPPIEEPSISFRDMVVAASRKQYAHKREEVEAAVMKFHEPLVEEKPKRSNDKNGNVKRDESGNASNRQRNEQTNSHADRRREPRPPREQNANRDNDDDKRQPPRDRGDRKRGHDLKGLRSVLKNISAESGASKNVEVSTAERNRDTKEKKEPNAKNELRGALAGILSQKPPQQSPASGATVQEEQTREEKPPREVTSQSSSQEPHGTKAQQETSPELHEEKQTAPEPSNGITPKELERMMRITTSDQPPPLK